VSKDWVKSDLTCNATSAVLTGMPARSLRMRSRGAPHRSSKRRQNSARSSAPFVPFAKSLLSLRSHCTLCAGCACVAVSCVCCWLTSGEHKRDRPTIHEPGLGRNRRCTMHARSHARTQRTLCARTHASTHAHTHAPIARARALLAARVRTHHRASDSADGRLHNRTDTLRKASVEKPGVTMPAGPAGAA
jgi:hypothetical protein